MLKKILFFVFFGLVMGHQAFTMTIAFACFQNINAHENSRNITGMFEDLLFEPFFDSGFIVTNVPLAKYSSEKDISLAKIKKFFEEEPSDYLVLLNFEYGENLIFDKKTQEKVPDWKRLKISLYEFADENEIFTKVIDINRIKGSNPERKAESLSGQTASEILAALKKNKK